VIKLNIKIASVLLLKLSLQKSIDRNSFSMFQTYKIRSQSRKYESQRMGMAKEIFRTSNSASPSFEKPQIHAERIS
jgi:hypothetical protein